jgi:hypothetical protein
MGITTKAQKLVVKFWPVSVILLLAVIFAYPYWAKGLVPFASTYLVTWFAPWNAYFGMPVKNAAMPDVISQIYPWRNLTIETFKLRQWPLWNPYNFSGNPHLANFQSAVFHPLNFLFFFLPKIDVWSLIVLLQPLLAGLFTYLFCQELRVSKIGSLISAIAFGFCGFIVVWMAYGTLGYALLWLPLAFYAIEKGIHKPSMWTFILISISVAFSVFSGHFQTSIYVILATFAYIVFRRAWILFVFLGLGILLAMPQILPSLEFYQQAARSEIFAKGEIIPWKYLLTLFSPDFYGNPVTRNDWFGHYAEWAGFFGVIPLLLAFYAVIRERSSYIWFFVLLGIFSLSLALPTPLLDLLIKLKIPVLSTSAASRIISLFSFSGAILAGFGFDQLIKDWQNKKIFKKTFVFLTIFAFFFLGVWGVLLFFHPLPVEKLLVAKRNFILPTGIFITFAGLSFVVWLLPRFGVPRKRIIHYSLFFILLLTAFDLLRFAKKWMPFDPKEYVYPKMPVIEFLKDKTRGIDRVFGNFGTETQTYFHIPAVEGYDPLYIRRYGEFITTAGDGKISQPGRSTVYLNKNGLYTEKILNLLGVKYILHTISDGRNIWAFPFWQYSNQFELIYKDEKHEVYQNKKVLPRAFLVYDFKVIKEDQEIVDKMLASDFDLGKTIILEENPVVKLSELTKEEKGKAEIINYTPTRIDINIKTPKPGLLFLSDNFYPGWEALVDNKPQKIYRADYTFRAIPVSSGEHKIRLFYNPPSFKIGLMISIISLALIGLLAFLSPKLKNK